MRESDGGDEITLTQVDQGAGATVHEFFRAFFWFTSHKKEFDL